jgi:acetyltransferase
MVQQAVDLGRLFYPRSIAIVGASSRPESISGQFLAHLTRYGYPGTIYPVNPRHPEVGGFPCYPSLGAVPGEVDLCLVLTPLRAVKATVDECVQKGVPYAVIPAAGFAEAGQEGAKLQKGLVAAARRGGTCLVGPNCMGFLNFKGKVAASFGAFLSGVPDLPVGPVAFVSQSGAFGGSMVRRCVQRGLGFTYHVSTGNEADLTTLDFLEYYIEDPDTRVIGTFIEGIQDASRLIALGKRAKGLGKSIVVLKAGKSAHGAQAVGSHTGRMAGSAEVYRGLFAQAGMIEVATARELADALETFAHTRARPASYGIAVVVASGGSGVLCTDYCQELGLEIPTLSQSIQLQLANFIPEAGSWANPVDVTAQVPHNQIEKMPPLVELVCQEERIGVVLIGLADRHFERCFQGILPTIERTNKLLGVLSQGGLASELERELLATGRGLIASDMRDLVQKVAFLRAQENMERRLTAAGLPLQCHRHEDHHLPPPRSSALTEFEIKQLLAPYLPVPRGELAKSADQASGIAERLGYPVVMKLVAHGLLHKTEAGAVVLNLDSPRRVAEAYATLMERGANVAGNVDGVLVEQQAESGTEVVVGFLRDQDLGPLVMVGSGGIIVELMRDVEYRALPATRQDIEDMLQRTMAAKLLRGFRNRPPGDVDGLMDLITEASALFLENGWMKELEFNPVMVRPAGRGVCALDVVVTAGPV